MEYKQVINREVDSYITDTFKNSDVRDFLLKHERKHILADNLTAQLQKTEHIIFSLDKTLEDKRKVVKGLVKDLANLFCKEALKVKAKELKSRVID